MKLTRELLDKIKADSQVSACEHGATNLESKDLDALIAHAEATVEDSATPKADIFMEGWRGALNNVNANPRLEVRDGVARILKEEPSRAEIAMHIHAGFVANQMLMENIDEQAEAHHSEPSEVEIETARITAHLAVIHTDALLAELHKSELPKSD